MILNIFKLEAPREKGKCGSKMAGKNIFDLYVFLVAKWLLFSISIIKTLLSLFVSGGWTVFGSHVIC